MKARYFCRNQTILDCRSDLIHAVRSIQPQTCFSSTCSSILLPNLSTCASITSIFSFSSHLYILFIFHLSIFLSITSIHFFVNHICPSLRQPHLSISSSTPSVHPSYFPSTHLFINHINIFFLPFCSSTASAHSVFGPHGIPRNSSRGLASYLL